MESYLVESSVTGWYRENTGNTVEENSSIFSLIQSTSCHHQGLAASKTLLQQNPLVLNWGYQLTQVVLYNGHKTVVVVVLAVALVVVVVVAAAAVLLLH